MINYVCYSYAQKSYMIPNKKGQAIMMIVVQRADIC